MLKEGLNGDFTLKTHQMFSVHTAREEFKNETITDHFDLCLRKTRSWKSRDYGHALVIEKLRFKNVFCPHKNE